MAHEDQFKIEQNNELGRYGVASRNLQAGDIVLVELPFAVGPKSVHPTVCLGCNAYVDGTVKGPRCPKCSWPLCGSCVDSVLHKPECDVFKNSGVKFQDLEEEPFGVCRQLDCITPLRVLLQKEANPSRWGKELEFMEHHEGLRRITDAWKADEINVVAFLRGPCKLDKFSAALIQKVIGILEVNAFEARTASGNTVRCLFPKLAIFSHSCVPNLNHSITMDNDFRMTCRTTVDIPKGGILNTTYTHTLWGTEKRQQHIKAGKFFICICERCKDPTELGIHFSSLKCQKCDPGLIFSTDPLDLTADWKCHKCEFTTSADAMRKMLSFIENEMTRLENMEFNPKRLEATEKLFKTYRSVFHPNHFVPTSLRQQLIEMIGQVEGYEINELPDVMLEHKVDLIKSVLKVLDVFEPGKTRARGNMLFELHVPLIYMAKTAYVAGLLTGEPLKEKFREVIKILKECHEILQWEDPNSKEGFLAQVSEGAIKQLSASIEEIED